MKVSDTLYETSRTGRTMSTEPKIQPRYQEHNQKKKPPALSAKDIYNFEFSRRNPVTEPCPMHDPKRLRCYQHWRQCKPLEPAPPTPIILTFRSCSSRPPSRPHTTPHTHMGHKHTKMQKRAQSTMSSDVSVAKQCQPNHRLSHSNRATNTHEGTGAVRKSASASCCRAFVAGRVYCWTVLRVRERLGDEQGDQREQGRSGCRVRGGTRAMPCDIWRGAWKPSVPWHIIIIDLSGQETSCIIVNVFMSMTRALVDQGSLPSGDGSCFIYEQQLLRPFMQHEHETLVELAH